MLWIQIRRIRVFRTSLTKRAGSLSQWYGSADPDPHQNVTDPQHWWIRKNRDRRIQKGQKHTDPDHNGEKPVPYGTLFFHFFEESAFLRYGCTVGNTKCQQCFHFYMSFVCRYDASINLV